MSGIWVVLDASEGRIGGASWEALSAARQLASSTQLPVNAAVMGAATEALTRDAAARSAGKIVRVEHPLLASYTPEAYTTALHQLFQAEQPSYVLFPHTYRVRDFAPALAARMGQAMISDVVRIGEGPVFERPLLQGRLLGSYRHEGDGPCFVSIQAGTFRAHAPDAGRAEVITFIPNIDPAAIRTHQGAPFRSSRQTADLGSAARIVSVGRGIKEAANLPLVEELATALGAELAASRPVCDSGWLPMERQIGSSGQTVSPRLYVAVGISGAIQHLVGMKGSQCIVAINKDPEAPIFEVADYGIAGDLFEVVPALTKALKRS